MIVLTREITDEVSFDRRDHHLHPYPRMKQVWQSDLLKGTSRIRSHNPQPVDYESDALPLDQPGLIIESVWKDEYITRWTDVLL